MSSDLVLIDAPGGKVIKPSLELLTIVVSGGRGTGGDFTEVEAFADSLGAAVGASRAAVDSGRYPHSFPGEINERLAGAGPEAAGATNADAVAAADVVLRAVPWDGHADLVASLAAGLAGRTVISCVNPLGFDGGGPFGLALEESAAQETQRLVPSARGVGGFHHVVISTV